VEIGVGIGRIVSGGQSGVDRAALDVAIAHRIPYGGWCPSGGWAEDHPEPPGLLALYPELRETPSADPRERTRRNVRDSDATLVLTEISARSPGTDLSLLLAAELGRPALSVALSRGPEAATQAAELLASLPAQATLNVAGPRESEEPGIYERSRRLLEALLG
jgi:hypothetical protein